MGKLPHQTLIFSDFTLDLTRGCLLRGEREVKLRPKSFQVLKFLVENDGRLVSKDELIAEVWAATAVTDDSLVQCLIEVPRALDDGGQHIIKTIPRRGYIFDAEVMRHDVVGREVVYTEEVGRIHAIVEEEEDAEAGGWRREEFGSVKRSAERLALPGTRFYGRRVALGLAAGLLVLTAGAFLYRRTSPPAESRTAPFHSIAVLPLKNLSDDTSNEYFSDGMTESLIMALSQVSELKVISRGSVIRFKGKEVDPREVGRQLGVTAVLEGSVRKSNDSVSVAVRLVSVEDGRVLWARDTHERALGDIFVLQDEIARNVVAGLKVSLSGAGAQQLARRYTDNVEAYQLYLKGRYFWNKRTEEGLSKSIEYFQQAINVDRNYALAYVGLADSYLVLKSLSLVTSQAAHGKVETALRRALEIDDTLGEAHKSLAWARFSYDWKWSEAEREFRRARELQPNDATTHQWYAEFLSSMGRFDESLAEIRRAQQLDPTSLTINAIAGQTYFFARRYDEAIEECRKTLEMDPDFFLGHDYLGWAYRQKGMHEEALAEFKQAQQVEDTPLQLCEVGIAYAVAGNKEGARKVIQEVMESSKRRHAPQHSFRLARIYAALGEPDAAFKSLEKAFNEREENLVWLKVDPHLDNLRSDPRFGDLLRRVGHTP